MKLNSKEFDRIVKNSLKDMPPEIKKHLKNILISVRRRPSQAMLKELGVSKHETLLGSFRGVSLMKRSVTYPPLFPATVFLFQESLEKVCRTAEELEKQIRLTVIHEVGHYIGLSEERLAELGC